MWGSGVGRGGGSRQGFLCVALVVPELTLKTTLASDSQIHLPDPQSWDLGFHGWFEKLRCHGECEHRQQEASQNSQAQDRAQGQAAATSNCL